MGGTPVPKDKAFIQLCPFGGAMFYAVYEMEPFDSVIINSPFKHSKAFPPILAQEINVVAIFFKKSRTTG